MARCTTPVVGTHRELVECPQCQDVTFGTVWHKRPRVYVFRCDKCGCEIRNERGQRPWIVQSVARHNIIPF